MKIMLNDTVVKLGSYEEMARICAKISLAGSSIPTRGPRAQEVR